MPFERSAEDHGRAGAYEVTTARVFRAAEDLRADALTAKAAYIRTRQAYLDLCRAAGVAPDAAGLPSIS